MGFGLLDRDADARGQLAGDVGVGQAIASAAPDPGGVPIKDCACPVIDPVQARAFANSDDLDQTFQHGRVFVVTCGFGDHHGLAAGMSVSANTHSQAWAVAIAAISMPVAVSISMSISMALGVAFS